MTKRRRRKPRAERRIEGKNPVLEALLAGTEIGQIWIAQGLVKDQKAKEIIRLATQRQIPTRKIKGKVLGRLSSTHRPQGVIALAASLPKFSLTRLLEKAAGEKDFCFLVLTEVLEEQNLGAILRTAEAAGVKGVVIPKKAKGITPVVTRTAMGAAEHLPVVKENLFTALKIFKDQGVKIVGAVLQASRSLYQVDLRGPVVFVVGGEHKGMTATLKKNCDLLISIPMRGKVSSLNMSVAGAVLVYEKLRQTMVKTGS